MTTSLQPPELDAGTAPDPAPPARPGARETRAINFGRIFKTVSPILTVAVFGLAVWILSRALADNEFDEVRAYIGHLPGGDITAAVLFTLASYAFLIGYDMLALRYVGRAIPLRTIALTSFISYAFTNSAGFGGLGALTGGSVRYRMYAAAGLTGFEITAVVAFCLVTFFVGALLTGGVGLTIYPEALAALHQVPPLAVRAIGIAMVAAVLIYVLWSALRRRVLTIGKWRLHIPTFEMAIGQATVAVLDIVMAGGALYQLMPDMGLSFEAFLPIYMVALIAGVISHVPGGLGVFEGLLIVLLPQVSAAEALAALVAYRVVYYLLPLALAAAALAWTEIYSHRRRVAAAARVVGDQVGRVAPQVYAIATFVAGTILLISGATPAVDTRLAVIEGILPLPVLEASHLIGSVVGVGLLLLSRALLRRLDGAYVLTLVLLVIGAIASLLKGLDYEEALFLLFLALALAPAREAFYRRAVLLGDTISGQWVAAVVIVIAGTTWLGFFSYQHVEYSKDLWWQFEFSGDAPRFLRASVAVALVAMAAGAVQLLRPQPPPPRRMTSLELARVQEVVAKSPDTRGHLALLDDKNLLFSAAEDGFIMYGVRGRTWAAMGDPIGPPAVRTELAWRFREICDRYDGVPVFYQVDAANLGLYVDLGLSLLKIGDEARVNLAKFSLAESAFSDLRYGRNRSTRDGGVFEIVPPEQVDAILPELAQVSDRWLMDRKTREKRFSVGFFNTDYLRRCPIAVVRKNGRVIAFTNLWTGPEHSEITVDLMRYVPGELYGVMDFMFIELMLWAKAQGYAWFNLGTAPLSGLDVRRLSPVWYRIGSLAYRFGDQFYNFQGLRKYKEKFAPEWRPKFLASPGGITLGRTLLDVSTLISGSVGGMVRK